MDANSKRLIYETLNSLAKAAPLFLIEPRAKARGYSNIELNSQGLQPVVKRQMRIWL